MAELKSDNCKKVIAYYLPQFHAIPENDKAWGDGFTEWVNTKKARPKFEGHYQPKIPLDENYYDLSDVKVMVEQSKLAKEYGLFGFCYYHYWFKDGKKLLEKPLEQMLKTPEVSMPFCLSWANENWTKRWDGGNEEIIVTQDYGDKREWKQHLEYLVQFFKDPRYITLEGCPIFLIYKPDIIPNVQKMLKYWQKLAPEYGFKRFCFMIQSADYYFSPMFYLGEFEYQIKFPPFYATVYAQKDMNKLREMQKTCLYLRKLKLDRICATAYKCIKAYRDGKKNIVKNAGVTILKYDETWDALLKSESNHSMIEGAFVDWDNTARKSNGYVHVGASPEKFEKYLGTVFDKIDETQQQPLVFLNAWNEWAEGAYLEPDTLHQYGYLEALRNVVQKQ